MYSESMTTNHYEANDREYDETQEMLDMSENTLPTPEQVIRDYAEWVRKSGCVGYDGHVESATTSLGSLTLTYADGTMWRLNMTTEYVGNRDHGDEYDDFDMGANNE